MSPSNEHFKFEKFCSNFFKKSIDSKGLRYDFFPMAGVVGGVGEAVGELEAVGDVPP
jgi:hypothetical protein